MRMLPFAAAALLAAPAAAPAQSIFNPFGKPGTPVGTPSTVAPVGSRLPNAGTPIGTTGGSAVPNQSTVRPPGVVVDLKNLSAPLVAPLPPELRPDTNSMIDDIYERWRNAIGITKPSQPANQWTPGISRRNRERHKFNWWWQ